ncbi:hypothetical protein DL93DRAFT_2070266 [Clavulina sp. PMI_390]|nr:hypothetical protein DL93DRAFT_2070266 [Clavulina sp. PMI_390]
MSFNGSPPNISNGADSPSNSPTGTLPPPSAASFATNFEILPTPSSSPMLHTFPNSNSVSALDSPGLPRIPPSPLSASFAPQRHRRGPSVSFTNTPASPASPSFMNSHRRAPSVSFTTPSSPPSNGTPSSAFSASGKRHGRIHSRNLSVFFPRPENAAASAIAEDDAGESGAPSPQRLEGFQFGIPSTPDATTVMGAPDSTDSSARAANVAKRKGHHHRHSVSHSFFSFMEPGGGAALTAVSPSNDVEASSPFVTSDPSGHFEANEKQKPRRQSVALPQAYRGQNDGTLLGFARKYDRELAMLFSFVQFLVGAALWAAGQSIGSLACTGLGYWIVFDSSSVAIAYNPFSLFSFGDEKGDAADPTLQKPFGSRRFETTVSFSQSIYLLFSGVYVLKEAVEHFLLSNAEEGHHHHRGDEGLNGISFPLVLLWLSLASVIFSNLYYQNHSRLVDATGTTLPDPATVLASAPFLRRIARPVLTTVQKSRSTSRILSNPFTIAPLVFSLSLLYSAHVADINQHITLDMLISTLETVWTFSIAYPTAVALGKILLQTAPDRGPPGSSGLMEAFLRVMREIERHPDVVHLPAPHFWQLNLPRAPGTPGIVSSSQSLLEAELVATVDLHVRKDMSDAGVLAITKWANDKCSVALGRPRAGNISISVVRG